MVDPDLVFATKSLLRVLCLPPNGLLILALLALALRRWLPAARRWAGLLALSFALLFWGVVSPAGSRFLAQSVERYAGSALDAESIKSMLNAPTPPGAIVVLGGGIRFDERDRPDGHRLSRTTLERVLGAARIARSSQLPILVSGGRPAADIPAEATVMAQVLREDFGVPVRWLEDASRDTADNAKFSAALLRSAGIAHIVLVTHAIHMPRARAAYESTGLRVSAAPQSFLAMQGVRARNFVVPDERSYQRASFACNEIIGALWYRLRGHIKIALQHTGVIHALV